MSRRRPSTKALALWVVLGLLALTGIAALLSLVAGPTYQSAAVVDVAPDSP